MSVLQDIQNALSGIGFAVGMGKYPESAEPCAKVIFTAREKSETDKPAGFLGGGSVETGAFKVIVRGNDYGTLEQKTDSVKAALKSAGFIPVGGYEDVEPKADETFMQIAVNFKFIK